MKITKSVLKAFGMERVSLSGGGGFYGLIKHVGDVDIYPQNAPKTSEELLNLLLDRACKNGQRDANKEIQKNIRQLLGIKE